LIGYAIVFRHYRNRAGCPKSVHAVAGPSAADVHGCEKREAVDRPAAHAEQAVVDAAAGDVDAELEAPQQSFRLFPGSEIDASGNGVVDRWLFDELVFVELLGVERVVAIVPEPSAPISHPVAGDASVNHDALIAPRRQLRADQRT
jgi:hypothetical protein